MIGVCVYIGGGGGGDVLVGLCEAMRIRPNYSGSGAASPVDSSGEGGSGEWLHQEDNGPDSHPPTTSVSLPSSHCTHPFLPYRPPRCASYDLFLTNITDGLICAGEIVRRAALTP